MGNWRTVYIQGTVAPEDLEALREACRYEVNYRTGTARGRHHCLSTGASLFGLNAWPAEQMNVIGNLAERNYEVADVARQLEELVQVAPSLFLKVHCGGDYEDTTCVATVIVAEGKVGIMPPMIETIPDMSNDHMEANLYRSLLNARRV